MTAQVPAPFLLMRCLLQGCFSLLMENMINVQEMRATMETDDQHLS